MNIAILKHFEKAATHPAVQEWDATNVSYRNEGVQIMFVLK
jgi:hypothetical protein